VRVSWLQSAFTGGEFGDSIKGRVDAERYRDAADTILNWVVRPEGRLERRPGTKHVTPTKYADGTVRLLPFEFNTEQAYILEFGDNSGGTDPYMRVHKDHAIVVNSTTYTITGATQASPVVVTTSAAHDRSNGDRVIITGVAGMTELNNREFIVANKAATTFELTNIDSANVDGTGYAAYSAGGTVSVPYEVVSPYAGSDLAALKYAQSADVLYLANGGYQPKTLSRTGHTSWTFANYAYTDGPYLGTNDGGHYLLAGVAILTFSASAAVSETSLTLTINAQAQAKINGGTGFVATDVGRLIRIGNSGHNQAKGVWEDGFAWGYCVITAYTSATEVTILVKKGWNQNPAGAFDYRLWRIGAWGDTEGWPSTVVFSGNRLYWGSLPNNPQRIDGSEIGDFTSFALTYGPEFRSHAITDANAVSFTLGGGNSGTVNQIVNIASTDRGLLISTTDSEWTLQASNLNEAITPTNVNAREQASGGSNGVRPIRVGNDMIYIDRTGRRVLNLTYAYDIDSLRMTDLTRLARHIGVSGLSDLVHVTYPFSQVYTINAAGELCGLTFERDPESVQAAWARHQLGGKSDAGGTIPQIESIAQIPTPDGTAREVWLVVTRLVNGATVKHLEYLTPLDELEPALEDCFFVDAGLTYDGASTATISGLYHLEGESVRVLGDGLVQASRTVVNGRIALETAASVVQVGLGYTSDLLTLKIEAGSQDGTALAKKQRIEHLAISFFRAVGTVKVGPSFSDLLNWSLGAALISGIEEDTFNSDYSNNLQVAIRVSDPVPCSILAINPQVSTYGRG